MSKELKAINIGERGTLIDKEEINYGYAMSELSKEDSRRLKLSLEEYNNKQFPKMEDGRYILEIDGMVVGVIVYKDGIPQLDRLPKSLLRLEWLDNPISSHRET